MLRDTIRLSKKAGGSVINHKPVFNYNSKILYIGCGSILRSFDTDTGEHIQDFDFNTISDDDKHEGNLVDISFHPFDRNVIICCYEGGHIIAWSFEINNEIKNLILDTHKKDVVGMKLMGTSNEFETFDIVLAVRGSKFHNKINLVVFSFKDGFTKFSCDKKFDCSMHSWSVTGPDGKRFIAAIERNQLTVMDVETNKINKPIIIGGRRYFTCVMCHPTDECIAAGDNTGRVILYYNFLCGSSSSPYNIFHWHTLPVNDIVFSQIGTYFYSGGSEHVLVKWTCNAPDVRHFLPRLPAPIVHLTVSPDNLLVAVSTLDNGILIINPQLNIKCSIQQFTWGFISVPNQKLFPGGLAVDSRSGCIVTNGRPGHIQFYSPQYSTLIYNMDITGENYLSQERDQSIINSEVVGIQFSSDGLWLATSQIRNDPEFHSDTFLKFWLFDRKSQSYKLKTCVTSYHEITKILFQPMNDELNYAPKKPEYLVATLCGDKKFRMWMEKSYTAASKKKYAIWNCNSVGYYRDHPLHDISFSSDGSILGAAFGPCFTIWDVETNTVKCSLTRGSDHISCVSFGHDDCSFIAVSANETTLFAWDLLSLTLLWSVALNMSILVADPCSGHVAVFTTDNDFIVFKLTSSEPVYRRIKLFDKNGSVLSAVFVPTNNDANVTPITVTDNPWLYNSSLYFFTSNQELMAFEVKSGSAQCETIITLKQQMSKTPFQALVAHQRTTEVDKSLAKQHLQFGIPWAQTVTQFLNSPAHTMPPVHMLCESLLKSLLISK